MSLGPAFLHCGNGSGFGIFLWQECFKTGYRDVFRFTIMMYYFSQTFRSLEGVLPFSPYDMIFNNSITILSFILFCILTSIIQKKESIKISGSFSRILTSNTVKPRYKHGLGAKKSMPYIEVMLVSRSSYRRSSPKRTPGRS